MGYILFNFSKNLFRWCKIFKIFYVAGKTTILNKLHRLNFREILQKTAKQKIERHIF